MCIEYSIELFIQYAQYSLHKKAILREFIINHLLLDCRSAGTKQAIFSPPLASKFSPCQLKGVNTEKPLNFRTPQYLKGSYR
jgi:hypothetical protein